MQERKVEKIPYRVLVLCLLLLNASCSKSKEEQMADTESDSAGVDADGDLSPAGEDCDDTNPEISPEKEEVPYDGFDNDCDSETPDDDLDGDGFGVEVDCDDEDESSYPGGIEEPYDGRDNDCNPKTLDDDLDGDGYAYRVDCDDSDPAIRPGVQEVCGNGVDENCSGEDLACGLQGTIDVVEGDAWFPLPDDYCAYTAVADMNQDGFDEVLLNANDKVEGVYEREGAYLFEGPFSGEITQEEEMDSHILYWSGYYYFYNNCEAPVGIGDVNGDGYGDLAASWQGDEVHDEVYILLGPLEPEVNTVEFVADITISFEDGVLSGSGFPTYIENFNGSGYQVIGFGDLNLNHDSTSLWIWETPIITSQIETRDALIEITDESLNDAESWGLASAYPQPGDLNGDGFSDYVAMDPMFYDGAVSGMVFLIPGPLEGVMDVADVESWIEGTARFGWSGGGIGDTDGDGYPEIAILSIDCSDTDDCGVYVFQGIVEKHQNTGDAIAFYLYEPEYETPGYALSGGDVNADGYSDLLVESRDVMGVSSHDVVRLLPGPLEGTYSYASPEIHAVFEDAYSSNTYADFNADGFADILLEGDNALYLFYGQTF